MTEPRFQYFVGNERAPSFVGTLEQIAEGLARSMLDASAMSRFERVVEATSSERRRLEELLAVERPKALAREAQRGRYWVLEQARRSVEEAAASRSVSSDLRTRLEEERRRLQTLIDENGGKPT